MSGTRRILAYHPNGKPIMIGNRQAYFKVGIEEPVDCKSHVGITIGLIDAIITIARIAAKRDLTHSKVEEALADLQGDEDVAFLLSFGSRADERERANV